MPTPKQASRITVQVVYAASAADITQRTVLLPAGSTLERALHASGLPAAHGWDSTTGKAGIFGKIVPLHTVLAEGDRVEMYRPVQQQAVQAARQRTPPPTKVHP